MIILNKMYSGKYLDSERNIGHEFINEYITDKKEQYIYVNPKDRVRKLSKKENNYTIQVRYAGPNCYEVLSCAKIIVDSVNKVAESGKTLKYGGCVLEQLYSENTMNGEMYAHLKASELKRCNPNTYLCFDDNVSLPKGATEIRLDKFVFGKRNSRRYVPKNKSESEMQYHDFLIAFINKKDYWQQKGNSTLECQNDNTSEINIIDVIGKQYEELTFSNWLSFYLRNTQLCKKFISECLFKASGISINGKENLLDNLKQPLREFNNIDIWLESKNLVIVIENKIDSGINGIKQTDDGKFTNQLEKYHSYADEERKGRNLYCFIIKPNYNQLSINSSGWHVIEYEAIYKFFANISNEEPFKDLPYIQEFVKALQPLKQKRKKDYKEIIENRLMKRIAELKQKKD